MASVLTVTEFLDVPGVLLDVRSPAEYQQGRIPGAISFPLFSDDERAQVGTCYKQQGRNAAVELGFAIAGPKFAGFIAQAAALAPDRRVRLHCWRGGMRSGAIAWVLELAGFQVSVLEGGYKAFRRWAMAAVQEVKPILILGGMTGTGKTDILTALAAQGEQVLDLEHLAKHRGSSYGALGLPPQPSNEQFENRVGLRWAKMDRDRPIWIEAESKRIGICRIPEPLVQQMEQAPILEIERAHRERLNLLVKHYGIFERQELIVATDRI
ncbi:MAG TPA: tRNA 2-selenouridine(34) synthase MnmH, partial [Chroococcidiopsis sp.]